MAQQGSRGLRSFVRTPAGRALLVAFGIAVVFGAWLVTILLAVPAILIAGLAVPIWTNQKRPRFLALVGLVIILLVAPLITVAATSEVLVPIGTASSGVSGVEWSVTVGGITQLSTSGSITFQLPNGSQNYSVAHIAGYAGPPSGEVTVSGASTNVGVTYTPVEYPVTFAESGLPAATPWGVSIGSSSATSTSTTLRVNLTNGTYDYRLMPVPGYTPPSPGGELRVQGAPVAQPIPFAAHSYPVTFAEAGLPNGSWWWVSADGVRVTSTGPTIVLALTNGTSPFNASSVGGFATPAGQNVVVAGVPVRSTVTFSASLYPVTFAETGLPNATRWSVEMNGVTVNSTGTNLTFSEPNGSYAYDVEAGGGYVAAAANGTFELDGAGVPVAVDFLATTGPVSFSETGLPAGTPWGLTYAATVLRSTDFVGWLNLPLGNQTVSVSSVPAGYVLNGSPTRTVDVVGSGSSVDLSFTALNYTVTFTESHLTAGSGWAVTLNDVTHSSNGTTVVFRLPNGTYPYSISGPSGKTPPAWNAVTIVSGAADAVAVPFASNAYAVTFTESGLLGGPATAVLQNASLVPFHSDSTSTVFAWTATVHPEFLSSTLSAPLWVELFLSTCPGALSNSSGNCTAGYSFTVLTDYLCGDPTTVATCEATAPNLTGPVTVGFNATVSDVGVWTWQMGVVTESRSLHTPVATILVGDPSYGNGLQGPVVGSFGTIFELILPTFYETAFLFLGIPFYVVLLLYAFLKARERRRADAVHRSAGPIPPSTGAESAGTAPLPPKEGGGSAPAPVPGEKACPNCGAVVYPTESKCWKCGTSLGEAPAPPLASK